MEGEWDGEGRLEHTHPLQIINLACHLSWKHQQNSQEALSILEERVGMLKHIHMSLIIKYAFPV